MGKRLRDLGRVLDAASVATVVAEPRFKNHELLRFAVTVTLLALSVLKRACTVPTFPKSHF